MIFLISKGHIINLIVKPRRVPIPNIHPISQILFTPHPHKKHKYHFWNIMCKIKIKNPICGVFCWILLIWNLFWFIAPLVHVIVEVVLCAGHVGAASVVAFPVHGAVFCVRVGVQTLGGTLLTVGQLYAGLRHGEGGKSNDNEKSEIFHLQRLIDCTSMRTSSSQSLLLCYHGLRD